MTQFIVSIFGGLALGATYSLIGLGLVLVFRTTGVFNLAHGELMLIAAYFLAAWETVQGRSFALGVVLALAVTIMAAIVMYLVILRWMIGLPHWVAFVATLVLAQVLDAALAIKYGINEYSITIPHMPSGAVSIAGARVGAALLVVAAVGIGLSLILIAVLRWTRLGTHIRAVGQDAVLASQGGIQVRRMYVVAWGVAGFLAAVAGILYGTTTIVDASLSTTALVAVPAMVLGGLDSFEGAIVGGLLIGIVQGFVQSYMGGQYVDVVSYALLLAFLLFYPQGLFGTADVTKV